MLNALVALIFSLAVLASLTEVCGQERLTPVILQAPSVNVQQTFAYGERRGFFKQEGIDMRIVVIKPHLATATLLSGDTQFTAQFQTAFYAGLRGAPVKALVIVNSRPGWYIIVKPEIKTGKDLKGKSIAVSGLGTSTHYAAMKVAAHFGLNPQRDMTYLGIGDDQSKLSAFKSGVVQAVQIGAPWHIEAKKIGGRELLFVGDIVELPTGGLGTSDKFLKDNPLAVNVIYQVFRGSGATLVDKQALQWNQGDIFVVPAWHWHSHENRADGDAILFSMTDAPTFAALGLYREECSS